MGPPGTGKSHLAIALGVEAVKAGRSVYFCTLADLLAQLARAEREGRLQERIRFFCRPALLIVDEIGYLPVVPGGGNLFFQLVNARYERGAMILTSNRGLRRMGRGVRRSRRRHGPARQAAAPRRRRSDRGLQLPPAPTCRTHARAPPVEGHHRAAHPGTAPTPTRPAPEKQLPQPGGLTGKSGDFYLGGSGYF